VIDKTIGLRVKEGDEVSGLDINLHEESGYRLS
jgi:Amt family ammonium transporter